MVPDEGIEPPTFGLQNRCSTAELIRRAWDCLRLAAAATGGKSEVAAWPVFAIDTKLKNKLRGSDIGSSPTNPTDGGVKITL